MSLSQMSMPAMILIPASVRPLLMPPHPQNRSMALIGEVLVIGVFISGDISSFILLVRIFDISC